jgi:serine acetyltransferase
MPSKIILGIDPWLSMAMDDWRLVEPSTELIPFEIKLDKNYLFKLPALDEYLFNDVTGFVAWGPEFLNFQRLELVGEFKKLGFKMPPLIHPTAMISSSAIIQENVWVHAFSYVGPNATIEFNSCVSIAAIIGNNASIQRNSWIGQTVNIQHGAHIGANTILGNGVKVLSKVHVGRQVRIEFPCTIETDLPDKSFHIQASGLRGGIFKIL